jgi:D-alanine-D-alanine ligase
MPVTTTVRQSRPRVAVIFGGRSAEHAISCVTAGSVLTAIDSSRYDVVPIGITRAGQWILVTDAAPQLAIVDGRLPSVEDLEGKQITLAPDPTALGLEIDVVFPLLHGPYGEDGTIQGMLELAGLPYVGSGVLASAVTMDKEFMKVILAARGIPIGGYAVSAPGTTTWRYADSTASDLGWPVFVKPARGGSSLGISRVTGPDLLNHALELAREHDPKVVIEAAIIGREIECGVLAGVAGEPPRVSAPAEILVGGGHDFYNFEAKYLDSSAGETATQLVIPALLPAATAQRIRELAVAAFQALGCEGLARVDFFLTPHGSVIVNEVNTMPGFTPTSMFPLIWKSEGVDYPDLIDHLIRIALDRGVGLR